jgi:ATP-dependent DNA ligase
VEEPILAQRPTDARVQVDSVEWLFGPDWPGRRLIARVGPDGVRLTDAGGAPAEGLAELAALLERAIGAERATIDGVWTELPFRDEEGDGGAAFVATDLLELDGEPLLDVPFQERHRLLTSVLREGVQVRVSPVVKQPIGGWLGGWREQGFTHYLAQHQNAPYHPGERVEDWFRIPIALEAPGGGMMGRLVGVRSRRPRRIRD